MHRGRGIEELGHGAFDGGGEGRLGLAQRWGIRISYQFRGSRLEGADLVLVKEGDDGLVVIGRAFANGEKVNSSF